VRMRARCLTARGDHMSHKAGITAAIAAALTLGAASSSAQTLITPRHVVHWCRNNDGSKADCRDCESKRRSQSRLSHFRQRTIQLRHDRPRTSDCHRRTDNSSQAARTADRDLDYRARSCRWDLLVRAIDAGVSRRGGPALLDHRSGSRDRNVEMGPDARKARQARC
jgi:hypothetical protein